MLCFSFYGMPTIRNENSLASDRIWTLADALPGEPGRDYPIFATAPETGFSCDDKHYGKIYLFLFLTI